MGWFKRIEIKYKIYILMILICSIVSILAISIVSSLSKVNSNINNSYYDGMFYVNTIHKINENNLISDNLIKDLVYIKNNNNGNIVRIKELSHDNSIFIKHYEEYGIDEVLQNDYLKYKKIISKAEELKEGIIKDINLGNWEDAKIKYLLFREYNFKIENFMDVLIEETGSKLAAEYNTSLEKYIITKRIIITLIFISYGLMVLLTYFFSRYISKRLNYYIKFADEISRGLYKTRVKVYSKDEIGKLGNALNIAAENIAGLVKKLEGEIIKNQSLNKRYMELEERYRLAVEASNEGIWDIDIKKGTIYLTDRCKEIIGFKDEGNIFDLRVFSFHIFNDYDLFQNVIDNKLKNSKQINNEFQIKRDGRKVYIKKRGMFVYSPEGEISRIVGSICDITMDKEREEKIFYLAYHDPLTGLPNRLSFKESFKKYTDKRRNYLTLIYINVVNIKIINEVFGHETGDEVLKYIGSKIEEFTGNYGDVYFIYYGYYAVCINNSNSINEIEDFTNRLLNHLKGPVIINNYKINTTINAGVSIGPLHGEDGGTLLKNSEIALDNVCDSIINDYVIYKEDFREKVVNRTRLCSELIKAVDRNEFIVYYQPKVNLKSNSIDSMEALIRWNNPSLGFVSPGKFIPEAENTGLIIDIGKFVLDEALKQNKLWNDKGYGPLMVSVNLSMRQIEQDDFVEEILKSLKAANIDPKYLELEITESMIIGNYEKVLKKLRKLKDFGISIALDDFGTGYSALNYLKNLPINTIKLDKSFVDNILHSKKDRFLTKSLIDLSHGMNLEVVAEGIETESQLKLIREINCDMVQGYVFSKPIPADEFEKDFLVNLKEYIF